MQPSAATVWGREGREDRKHADLLGTSQPRFKLVLRDSLDHSARTHHQQDAHLGLSDRLSRSMLYLLTSKMLKLTKFSILTRQWLYPSLTVTQSTTIWTTKSPFISHFSPPFPEACVHHRSQFMCGILSTETFSVNEAWLSLSNLGLCLYLHLGPFTQPGHPAVTPRRATENRQDFWTSIHGYVNSGYVNRCEIDMLYETQSRTVIIIYKWWTKCIFIWDLNLYLITHH